MKVQSLELPSNVKQQEQWEELQQLIVQAGLLKKQYLYYAVKIAVTLCLLGMGLTCLVLVDYFWAQVANAVFWALVFAQIGLIAHASGHEQIFISRSANKMVSIAAGFCIGLSRAWWHEKHTIDHHSNPNNLLFDPDVRVSVLAFTQEQVLEKKGLYRFTAKYQHLFFFPVLLLEALSIRADSLQYLVRKERWIELTGMCLHIVGYALLLVFFLESWTSIAAFFAVHQGLLGLFLGLLFATNHKGMEMLQGKEQRGYLWAQVPTTRNVRNPKIFDWWFGGLNFQIEHHLFPAMPQNKLRKAREIVKPFCHKHRIPYCETGFCQTYKEILQHLQNVSRPLRS